MGITYNSEVATPKGKGSLLTSILGTQSRWEKTKVSNLTMVTIPFMTATLATEAQIINQQNIFQINCHPYSMLPSRHTITLVKAPRYHLSKWSFHQRCESPLLKPAKGINFIALSLMTPPPLQIPIPSPPQTLLNPIILQCPHLPNRTSGACIIKKQ